MSATEIVRAIGLGILAALAFVILTLSVTSDPAPTPRPAPSVHLGDQPLSRGGL